MMAAGSVWLSVALLRKQEVQCLNQAILYSLTFLLSPLLGQLGDSCPGRPSGNLGLLGQESRWEHCLVTYSPDRHCSGSLSSSLFLVFGPAGVSFDPVNLYSRSTALQRWYPDSESTFHVTYARKSTSYFILTGRTGDVAQLVECLPSACIR